MDDLGLILFDVDGTLVDSQSEILSAMSDAFAAISRPTPSREMILSTVGLSLDQAMMRLLPDGTDLAVITRAILAYKNSYRTSREAGAMSVTYPGIATMLAECAQHSNWLLGLATGQSRRGVSALIVNLVGRRYFRRSKPRMIIPRNQTLVWCMPHWRKQVFCQIDVSSWGIRRTI